MVVASYLDPQLERDSLLSSPLCLLEGFNSLMVVGLSEGVGCSPAIGWRHPSVPCVMGLSNRATCHQSVQAEKAAESLLITPKSPSYINSFWK